MRKLYPSFGDKRIKTKFLWFPLCIDKEQRWLEKASWEEEYMRMTFFDNGNVFPSPSWEPTKWLDNNDIKG